MIYKELLGIENDCWKHFAVALTNLDFNPVEFDDLQEYEVYLAEKENEFKESFREKF